MEIEDLLQTYENLLNAHTKELDRIVIEERQEMVEVSLEVQVLCEKMKDAGISYRVLDRLDEDVKELFGICESARAINDAYARVISVRVDDLESFVSDFIDNQKFFNQIPVINSKLLDQLNLLIKKQKDQLTSLVKAQWENEFKVTDTTIYAANRFEIIKGYMEKLGIWNQAANTLENIFHSFFNANINRELDLKVKTSHIKLIAKQDFFLDFKYVCLNIHTFIGFFQKFVNFSSSFVEKIEDSIVKVFEIQAGLCSSDESVKKSSISSIVPLKSTLESVGISYDKVFELIRNCKETSLISNKNLVLSSLRDLLKNSSKKYSVTDTNTKITDSTKEYIRILQSLLNPSEKSETVKIAMLSTIKEGIILYECLRETQKTPELKDSILICSDFEYILHQAAVFSKSKSLYPDYLEFLLDYSNITPLIQSKIDNYYDIIFQFYQKTLSEKLFLFDFKEFVKNYSYQEAILISILYIIKNNEFKDILPRLNAYNILGKIIDCLIADTIDRVLGLQDIYEKDISLFKNFFDKIFAIKEVFDGNSPVEYCKEWERLEALLEIIEGKLIEIIKMFERKRFAGVFTTRQLRKLIKALFEDSDKRSNTLKIII